MNDRPASTEAVAVIATWPNGDWLTEAELAEHLEAEDHPVQVTQEGFQYGAKMLRSVLNEARRRSWLIRDQRQEPTVYQRTPRGASDTSA